MKPLFAFLAFLLLMLWGVLNPTLLMADTSNISHMTYGQVVYYVVMISSFTTFIILAIGETSDMIAGTSNEDF